MTARNCTSKYSYSSKPYNNFTSYSLKLSPIAIVSNLKSPVVKVDQLSRGPW